MESDDPKLMGLDNAHYAAIGRVAASWAYLEMILDGAIQDLSGLTEEVSVCIVSQIAGHARKRDAILSLVRLRGGTRPIIRALNKIFEDITAVAEMRNRVVHDPWLMTGVDDGEVVSVNLSPLMDIDVNFRKNRAPHRVEATARKSLKLGFVPMSTSEVEAVRTKIEHVRDRFEDEMRDFLKRASWQDI